MPETLPSVSFSSNWNSKLNCDAFSTIRLRNDKKYHLGNMYTIVLKENPIYNAQLVALSHFYLLKLSDAMSFLDTGYNAAATIKMLLLMYKNKNIDVQSVMFSYLVFYHKKIY